MIVRRFLCSGSGCSRHIFAEPLDGFADRYARTTTPLARKIAVPTSPDASLRRIKQVAATDQFNRVFVTYGYGSSGE